MTEANKSDQPLGLASTDVLGVWFRSEEALPKHGRSVVADDCGVVLFDSAAGWLRHAEHQGLVMLVPTAAPARWRYMREDEQLDMSEWMFRAEMGERTERTRQ